MRSYFLPIIIIALFFVSAFFLTLRQEFLFHKADQEVVTAAYLDPGNTDDASFFVSHQADTPRTVTIEYHYQNQPTKTETVTLKPQEKHLFSPDGLPLPATITIRYQDNSNQEHVLTLYKK